MYIGKEEEEEKGILYEISPLGQGLYVSCISYVDRQFTLYDDMQITIILQPHFAFHGLGSVLGDVV